MKTLSNDSLTIQVSPQGAELSSIVANATQKEYLWQADPAFWKRHSPVLFPIVGSLWNNEYHHNGITYHLSQHGFARDKEFELIKETDTELRFKLQESEDTLKLYPFPFYLEIGYRLAGNQIEIIWVVKNTGNEELYFQIGAHPAFYYPDYDENSQKRGFFAFDRTAGLTYKLIQEKGCIGDTEYPLPLDEEGLLPLDTHTFDKDALVIEDSQVRRVDLLNPNGSSYLTVYFTAPVVGLWSPPAKNAPFVCIEPWYGRCDRVNYSGEYKDRDWMQYLQPGETFNASYLVEIHK
ncbi:aldose 1-epimerase family protein [Parabacteroides gordonii]|jgi:galactose mutarotase-like enzyme|uniref:aldose 1-epimerase family protein n=1 Tax=Parabacteroides gordonii TaxID=574930 RepID=UPI00241EE2B6|nr:aldose 1-epimerase family protein [Parabacteroides gordonii]